MGAANRKATPAELVEDAGARRRGDARRRARAVDRPRLRAGRLSRPPTRSWPWPERRGQHGGIYISHMRDEGGGVLDSVRETIAIGEGAKIPRPDQPPQGGWPPAVRPERAVARAHRRGARARRRRHLRPVSLHRVADRSVAHLPALGAGRRQAERAPRERRASGARSRPGMLSFIDERFGDDPSRIQLVRCGHDPALAGQDHRRPADGREAAAHAIGDGRHGDRAAAQGRLQRHLPRLRRARRRAVPAVAVRDDRLGRQPHDARRRRRRIRGPSAPIRACSAATCASAAS